MDVLDGNLKAIEAAGFRRCDFRRKIAAEVLVDDAVRCSEEGKDVGDEVTLVVVGEAIPICSISLEVYLLGGPNEASAFLYIRQISLCWMGKRTKR